MSEHTPLPWFKMGAEPCDILAVMFKNRLGMEKGLEQKVASVWGESGEQAKANADFIIRAVNCHDELLAALKRCVLELAASPDLIGRRNAIVQARAAIAKAEGKE